MFFYDGHLSSTARRTTCSRTPRQEQTGRYVVGASADAENPPSSTASTHAALLRPRPSRCRLHINNTNRGGSKREVSTEPPGGWRQVHWRSGPLPWPSQPPQAPPPSCRRWATRSHRPRQSARPAARCSTPIQHLGRRLQHRLPAGDHHHCGHRSGTGITDASNGTVDIGASDAYLAPSAVQANPDLLNIRSQSRRR